MDGSTADTRSVLAVVYCQSMESGTPRLQAGLSPGIMGYSRISIVLKDTDFVALLLVAVVRQMLLVSKFRTMRELLERFKMGWREGSCACIMPSTSSMDVMEEEEVLSCRDRFDVAILDFRLTPMLEGERHRISCMVL